MNIINKNLKVTRWNLYQTVHAVNRTLNIFFKKTLKNAPHAYCMRCIFGNSVNYSRLWLVSFFSLTKQPN